MSRIGEFQRIDRFLQSFRSAGGATTSAAVQLGPGDDAALLVPPGPLVITTDALVEGVHFRRSWSSWEQIGRKALAVNLSDLAAMGSNPVAFTCALTVPDDVDDEALQGISRGLAQEASPFGCVLAGGNFARGHELNIAITAFGLSGPGLLRRDRARSGDAVLLIGELGVAAAELRWLEDGRTLPPGRSALLEPQPLIQAGLAAVQHASCGIDVSDGLIQDLGHIARASDLAIHVSFEGLPRSERFLTLTSNSTGEEAAHFLLAGGEDYALLVLGSAVEIEQLRHKVCGVIIGTVDAGAGVHVHGAPPGTVLTGHDHFR